MPAEFDRPEDPRIIKFKDSGGSFEISVRINNPGMDDLDPRYREVMTDAAATFAITLISAVDETSLQESGATTGDFLKHILHGLGRVTTAFLNRRIKQDPEQIEPTSDTPVTEYAPRLAAAYIQTREGLAAAKARITSYARIAEGLIGTSQHDPIEGSEAVLNETRFRILGMDEAISLIEGRPVNVPEHLKGVVDFFNPADQNPPVNPPTP